MLLLRILGSLFFLVGYPVVWLGKNIFQFWTSPISLKRILKKIYPAVSLFSKFRLPRLTRLHFPRWQIVFIILIGVGSLGLGIWWYAFKDLPSPKSLSSQPVSQTTHIRDRHGIELYKIYRSQNRTLVSLSDLPLALRQATISIEDKEFYSHPGFSIAGIARAAWKNVVQRSQQGGSTITQQLVKTALLTSQKTFQRKVREVILAVAVETLYSKDQILEMYLNRVSYGGAAYGVEEAAQTYFDKSAGQLDLAQSALLAGLPASPTTYSPYGAHPELAKARQKEVLQRMVEDGYITWEQAESAAAEELDFVPQHIDIKAPHFVMYIKELLASKYGADAIEQGGLDVVTSLDLSVQNQAQAAVTQEIAKVTYLKIGNGAALVTNPSTGEILAMVGSKNYFNVDGDGNVNVTTSLRQPGSSIKPINYALAFTRGFTPASIIDDSPITYRIPGQAPYAPVNYDGKWHGKVSIRTALASSYNVPAVKVLSANGVQNMITMASKLGINSWGESNRFGLSLTLGGGEVRMLDMAVAYGVFANSGKKVELHPILSVRDSNGRLLEELRCDNKPISAKGSVLSAKAAEAAATEIVHCDSEDVLDSKIAFMISDILSDNTARTPAFGPKSDLYIPGSQVAVKTGTTNNMRDNWTIGYTPNRLVAVWVGNNDNTPMSYVASGVTGASPIWRRIMDQVLIDSPSTGFPPPPDLLHLQICSLTGQLACGACPSREEYFIPGTEPKQTCSDDTIKKIQEEIIHPQPTPTIYIERDRILEGIIAPTPRNPKKRR